ncbi:MAG: S41 family peptidase [Prevotellaceae bacterium]|jgi:carboxyl-terminal processing protease|nr:S41 family peptidase [Prevotellaceae bacterium]
MSYFRKLVIILAFTNFAGNIFAQSKDFDITKNLEIFFSALRELQNNYIDSLSTEQLIAYALEGITEHLDPYTKYVPAEQQTDFDFQTTGKYAGIGSLIQKDSGCILVAGPYRNLPADKAGLVAGDKIMEIDGKTTSVMSVNKASSLLKGDANTVVKLKVLKLRTGELADLSITRENIRVPSVPYSNIYENGTGYIRFPSFTVGSSNDIRNVLTEFRATGNLKSLILDMRGNGGGPLVEAVGILNLFLPKGITVVTSSGRKKETEEKYVTRENPVEPDLPLVILVDNSSASATEIVSGTIQDLDRGIIVGTNTFGKGYVQSVRPIGYDAQLTYTIAKYYIPSGRCVQAHNFATFSSDGSVSFIPDSLKKEFKTKNGRTVFDAGGVTPDVVIRGEEYSPMAVSLMRKNLIFKYSIEYFRKNQTSPPPDSLEITEPEYQDFINYLSDKEYDYQTASEMTMKRLINAAKQEKYYDNAKNSFDELNALLKHDKAKDLRINQEELVSLLREEISERYYYEEGRLEAMLRRDKQFDEAYNILNNPDKYNKLLNNPTTTAHNFKKDSNNYGKIFRSEK